MAENRQELNRNLAQMLKGGVIMDVTTPEQARIAEAAGACAVMALERIPADIRAAGGVSRMSDPKMIKGIQEVHVKKEKLDQAERFMADRGAWMGFFAFIPILGSAITIVLGLTRATRQKLSSELLPFQPILGYII